MLPKQGAVGSNPITRSREAKGGACLTKMSINRLLARYSLSVKSAGLSDQTVDHTRRSVGFFDEFLGGVPDVRRVTANDLRRFIVGLQAKPKWAGQPQQNGQRISPTSINSYVRAIKSFWSWLQREGIIKSNPLATMPAPKIGKRLPKVLTEDELRRVLRVASQSDRDYALISLFVDSGIRLSELCGLTPDDVENDRVRVIGKGDKERYAYISKETRLAVTLYYTDERPEPVADNKLFLNRDGRPLTTGRVQKVLERIGKAAEVSQRLAPHKLRHSFATLSLRYGSNLEVLRRQLGHTDIKTTEIYIGLSDADVAEAHKKTSPVTNLLAKKVK